MRGHIMLIMMMTVVVGGGGGDRARVINRRRVNSNRADLCGSSQLTQLHAAALATKKKLIQITYIDAKFRVLVAVH